MSGSRVPDTGDLIWLTIVRQAGREQDGRRPALVLSPATYNAKAGLALACPITSKAKGYPFEVGLPEGLRVSGVILADQLKSVDWKARGAEHAGSCPAETVEEVRSRLAPLLGY